MSTPAGQYGSGASTQPRFNQQYPSTYMPNQGSAQQYALNRLQQMPQMQTMPSNPFGGMGGGYRPRPSTNIPLPGSPNQGGPIGPGGQPAPNPDGSINLYSPRPNDMRIPPNEQQFAQNGQPIFTTRPMGIPQAPSFQNDMRQEPTSGLHPYQPPVPQPAGYVGQTMSQPAQQAPTQNSLAAQAAQNMNLWANPMNLSQAQLGPSFNPAGSSQGGYFNGQQYVPNVGNARNGLDILNRAGMNWNGSPLNGGGLLIR